MEVLVNLCKARGFVFPGSEIYGGLANTWDYGPLGSQLKKNIKDLWWTDFVTSREDMVGLDSSILLNSKVWEASGHVANFTDPMVDCKSCKSRHRADHLIESKSDTIIAGQTVEQMSQMIKDLDIACPVCGKKDFTAVRTFNLLFETRIGAVSTGDEGKTYLRGETAQGIFINFKNVLNSTRAKLPFGVGQIGKSFRNEITPGNFIFRTLEFEQAEIEYFFDAENTKWEDVFENWQGAMMSWLSERLGLKADNLRIYEHKKEALSHYSKRTIDVEYNYPFGGFKELWGLAYRGNFDLTQHQQFSGESMEVFDQENNRKYLPHVIEPAVGVDRLFLAALVDAYDEEEVNGEKRTVLRFNHRIAPFQIAILPLSKKEELMVVADPIYKDLQKQFRVDFDETQSIGKRYRRQDEIGTPYCVTVDFDSINDKKVTVRDRDTMLQERIAIDELKAYFTTKFTA